MSAAGASPVELRYRALTHHNPGVCAVTVYRMDEGPWVCVAENLDGHLGPPVRTAVRAVAAVIHRELIPAGVDWCLVLVAADGRLERVEWGEAFGGWFARPRFAELRTLVSLVGILPLDSA
jgi:hypothetical protein